jgi:hypothetical protein
VNRKTLVITGGAVAAGILVAGGITLAVALQRPAPGEQYVASSLHDLRVVQQGAHSYDVSFQLPEAVDASAADDLTVELTDTPDYRAAAATDAAFTVDGDRVQLATTELEAGDHFLWVTTGDAQASVTVTIPDMAPRVWIGDDLPHIEFDQAGDSSWSSYVDPEGKNVYRSASPVFDESAEPIAEGLAITETSYRVDDPAPDAPYYFLVFTGHGGDSTFVSSPIFADAEQGQLAVELRSIDGAPHYVISGFLASRKADDVERTMRLRVGSFDPANPASTFFVENTAQDAETAEAGRFRFEVPARELAQGYNDLAVFLTEDGATLEWSLDATGVDLAQRVVDGGSVFGMRRAEALQLTRLDLPYERLDVRLAESGSSAVLRVTGTFTEEQAKVGYRLVVKDATGERYVVDDGAASARYFSYTFDLGRLDQSSVWYDVEFLDPADDVSVPISTLSVADMRQWVATETRTYAFAEYDGLLKVFFDASPFVNAHVELATVDGVPSLVATGQLVDTANSDAFLRIRSGDTVVQDVANSSTTRGQFRFVFDLRKLPRPDVWFDVAFRKASTNTLRDFPVRAADMNQKLSVDSRAYSFHEWNGQLKIAYAVDPGTVNVTNVKLVDVAGVPTLRIEGALDRLSATDARLRIRSGSQAFDVANSATAPGRARFDYNLSSLTSAGTWYDVLIGSASANVFTDVSTTGVDLAQTLSLGGRLYDLHDWNAQLKVAFTDVSRSVAVSTVEVVDVTGAPTLRVTGTVSGTGNADAFLRIRTGSTNIDVPNIAAAAGDALFEYDLSGLSQAGTWYDVLVGIASTGTLVDVPATTADTDQTLALGGRTYGFRDFQGDLKVTFDVTPVAVTPVSAELLDVSGVPTLRVQADYVGTSANDLFLRVRTGTTNIDVPNGSTVAGHAVFDYDLSGLTSAGTWYDLLIGATSSGQLVDLPDSIASMTQTVTLGGREYGFREYNHDLKVTFSAAAGLTVTSAQLVDVDGVPTLRVTGTTSGLTHGDAFLRIRAGAQTVEVPDTATAAGEALFEYDLSGLTEEGTWYDLLARVVPTGSLVDLAPALGDLTRVLERGGRAYSFHEYNGGLKVAFVAVDTEVTVSSTALVGVAGQPVLRVTGNVSGTASGDAFLRIRAGAQTVDVPNTATIDGDALFEYALTGLMELDAYELLTGITSRGTLAAVPSSTADLDDTLTLQGRQYGYADVSGDLSLTVETAPSAAEVSQAEIVEAGGVPTLRVTGTTTGVVDDADVFLRIRSGSGDVDVPNTAPTPGAALFEYDPTALATGSFELLIGSTSTGSLTPVDSALADLSQVVGHAGRSYGFGQASGELLLTIADTPAAVTVAQAQIVSVSGVPTLRVTGTVVGTGNTDAFLRIRTPSVQTVDVPNTATAPGQALFEYDLRGLTLQGSWYDVLTGVTSTGVLTDVSDSIANLSQTAIANSRSYGFRTWEGALKVVFSAVTATVSPSSAELVNLSGIPTLRVTGTFTNTDNADVFLRVRTGSTNFDVANTAAAEGQFRFAFDASALTQPGTWYDVLVGVTSSGALTNLTPAIANLSQTIDVGDRRYSFHEWSGQLKVSFADISVTVTPTSAQLVDVAGTPTLRVAGTVTNTVNSDVFLRIRTGSTNLDVPNAATSAGQLSFDFALAGLTQPGTWYDVLIGVTSKGTLLDLPTSVADLAQTISQDGRSYTFQEWSGQLKVAFSQRLLGAGESVRIDFGPNDVNDTTRDGNATVTPDANGHTWNNLSWPNASAAPAANTSNVVPNGLNAAGLRTTAGVATTTKVTANGTNWLTNGINTGGLLAPNTAYLGEFAIATATQDYFFVQSSGTATLTLSGLDPWREYDLRFFGTRQATDVRKTTYTAVGSDGEQTVVLQTTGAGIGAGGYNGNNNTIVTIENAQPQADGTMQIKVTATQGGFGYLGFLEITGDAAVTPPPPPPPAEVQRWVSQDAADPLADESVLFIGSSSIRRWETLTRDFADYNVIQRGWGGSWFSGVNDYSPWVAWPYEPRAIVMWAGTNDLNGGQSAQWVLDEYREFVTNMRANSPGSDFFWISILPNYGNADKNAVRMQANALIKAEIDADTTGKLHYIDLATYFEHVRDTDPNLFRAYYVDDLHMSRLGYAKWLEVVRPSLESVVAPNKAVAANANTLQPGEKLFFDFGPSDPAEGDPTVTAGGNHWNNWVPTGAGGLVNVGEHVAGLVDSTGRNTGIGMTIAAGFQVNGKTKGGLLSPDPAKFGPYAELAVPTATEDYFYSSADGLLGGSDDDLPGGIMMTGLDPAQEYEFRFLGSRNDSQTRVTEYAVAGATSGSAQLQTSGPGSGSSGNGNDDDVAVVSGVRPDAFGQVWIDVTVIQGSYAHLNAMEVIASPSTEPEMLGLTAFVADEVVGEPVDAATPDVPRAEQTEPAASGDPSVVPTAPAEEQPAQDEQPADAPAPVAPSDPAVVPGGNEATRAERNSARTTGRRCRP